MTKNVRNSESPMMTWFGGTPCVPSAERVKPSTMTIRVNAVIMIRPAGTRLTTPSRTTSASGEDSAPLLLRRSRSIGDVPLVVDVDDDDEDDDAAGEGAAGRTGEICSTPAMPLPVSGAACAT